ncbi:hypothetical protein [Luteimonas aquatica]|uniref:hypothetical protein n=1 Tax=Luteimonas aquatica TaxID=450364 RepID=UPI001F59F31D|nr:hypothetical protein [Luteimonas aquatica]
MIRIELGSVPRLQGQAVRQQSLWLLLRMWLAASQDGDAGWVRERELRERFAATRNLRMVISRAYADFERWGVRAGWGKDRERPLHMLPLAGRSRGPYWLAPGEAQRLEIALRGAAADAEAVALWLGLPADASATGDAQAFGEADPSYWHAWAGARRDMLDGRLIVDGGHGALAGYRHAQALASDARWQALALLQQAMVWRRAGNADAARAVLDELDRHWHDVQAPEHAWLGAMAAIVRAWCAYAERDAPLAGRILRDAVADARWTPLFEHHPRVRCEHANLQALIHRAFALDAQRPLDERRQAAETALRHYRLALTLANESELFDAAASTASNLGWSIWLFERCGLQAAGSGPHSPLTWIALAAWLSEHHGVGGGCWNSIYLLRMARGGGPDALYPDAAGFRRWPVLGSGQFRAQVAPIELRAQWSRWLDLALALQAEVDGGRLQIDALQRCNLLLEVAWYQAYEGDPAASAAAAARLRRRLRELVPADRVFFREALRRLPRA